MTTAGRGARAGQADRELERIERAMRAGDARAGPATSPSADGDLDERQRDVERGVGLARVVDRSRSGRPRPRDRRAGRRPRRTAAGRSRARLSQHLATTSGPIPAGSPSETASGEMGAEPSTPRLMTSTLAEFDHRVAAKVAQVAAGAQLTRSSLSWLKTWSKVGAVGLDLVAAADHQRRARLPRASRTGGWPGRPASAA